MTTPNPRAVLLDQSAVAARLGWGVAKVAKARHATDPNAYPPPMPGWVQTGPDTHPAYRISEAALIDYIETLRAA